MLRTLTLIALLAVPQALAAKPYVAIEAAEIDCHEQCCHLVIGYRAIGVGEHDFCRNRHEGETPQRSLTRKVGARCGNRGAVVRARRGNPLVDEAGELARQPGHGGAGPVEPVGNVVPRPSAPGEAGCTG